MTRTIWAVALLFCLTGCQGTATSSGPLAIATSTGTAVPSAAEPAPSPSTDRRRAFIFRTAVTSIAMMVGLHDDDPRMDQLVGIETDLYDYITPADEQTDPVLREFRGRLLVWLDARKAGANLDAAEASLVELTDELSAVGGYPYKTFSPHQLEPPPTITP